MHDSSRQFSESEQTRFRCLNVQSAGNGCKHNHHENEEEMKEINTIGDLVEVVQNELSPKVDNSLFWSRVAAGGALIGGLATLGLFVLECIKTFSERVPE